MRTRVLIMRGGGFRKTETASPKIKKKGRYRPPFIGAYGCRNLCQFRGSLLKFLARHVFFTGATGRYRNPAAAKPGNGSENRNAENGTDQHGQERNPLQSCHQPGRHQHKLLSAQLDLLPILVDYGHQQPGWLGLGNLPLHEPLPGHPVPGLRLLAQLTVNQPGL